MSNLLFIAMFGTGHVNPTIGLIKELVNREEKVTYSISNKNYSSFCKGSDPLQRLGVE